MPANWVHQTLSIIVFGLPYGDLHRRKDEYAARAPGVQHRRVRHRTYQAYRRKWTFDNVAASDSGQAARIAIWKGLEIAECHQVSVAHDIDDRIWDYEGVSRDERALNRKCLEVFCAWLVLNPESFIALAQVDVLAGKIHRLVDGEDVWELEPGLCTAYCHLRRRVETLVTYDQRLRKRLAACDATFREALRDRSNCSAIACRS